MVAAFFIPRLVSIMAKPKQVFLYGLNAVQRSAFRRTVAIGKGADAERVQLVFEPGIPLELSAHEVAGLQREIEDGIIVAWEHGKPVARSVPSQDAATIEALRAENAALTEQVAALAAQVAELTAQVEELTDPDESDDDTETVDDDAPLGDE